MGDGGPRIRGPCAGSLAMTPVHPSDRPVNQTGSPTSSGPMSSGDKPQVPQKPAASPPPQSFSACPVLSGTPATISPTPVPTGRGWAWPGLACTDRLGPLPQQAGLGQKGGHLTSGAQPHEGTGVWPGPGVTGRAQLPSEPREAPD